MPNPTSGLAPDIIDTLKNACPDIGRAVNEAVQIIFDGVQWWINNMSDLKPAEKYLIDLALEELQKLVDQELPKAVDEVCEYYAENILPLLLSPMLFLDAADGWQGVADTATDLSKHIKNYSQEGAGDDAASWTGAGYEAYTKTGDAQAECAAKLRESIQELPGILTDVAGGLIDLLIAIAGAQVATAAEITTIAVSAAIPPAEAGALVIAVVEAVAGLIAQVIALVAAIKELVFDAMGHVTELNTKVSEMKELASNGRTYWNEPGNPQVAPGTTGWDDGF